MTSVRLKVHGSKLRVLQKPLLQGARYTAICLETTLPSHQLVANSNLERLSAKLDYPWTVQVAQAGLVPVLVALLEQVPCPSRAEVQDQAACLLLEAAASDLGMVHLSSTSV